MDDMAEFGVRTGWPSTGRLMQDDSRELSCALSRDPQARRLVRESAERIFASRRAREAED